MLNRFPTRDDLEYELSHRIPKKVKKILVCENGDGFPVCPACKKTIEREYQSYCDRCGQKLNWRYFNEAKVIYYKDYKKWK